MALAYASAISRMAETRRPGQAIFEGIHTGCRWTSAPPPGRRRARTCGRQAVHARLTLLRPNKDEDPRSCRHMSRAGISVDSGASPDCDGRPDLLVICGAAPRVAWSMRPHDRGEHSAAQATSAVPSVVSRPGNLITLWTGDKEWSSMRRTRKKKKKKKKPTATPLRRRPSVLWGPRDVVGKFARPGH